MKFSASFSQFIALALTASVFLEAAAYTPTKEDTPATLVRRLPTDSPRPDSPTLPPGPCGNGRKQKAKILRRVPVPTDTPRPDSPTFPPGPRGNGCKQKAKILRRAPVPTDTPRPDSPTLPPGPRGNGRKQKAKILRRENLMEQVE